MGGLGKHELPTTRRLLGGAESPATLLGRNVGALLLLGCFARAAALPLLWLRLRPVALRPPPPPRTAAAAAALAAALGREQPAHRAWSRLGGKG